MLPPHGFPLQYVPEVCGVFQSRASHAKTELGALASLQKALKKAWGGSPGGLVVKDSVLSSLWRELYPWPGELHMLQV